MISSCAFAYKSIILDELDRSFEVVEVINPKKSTTLLLHKLPTKFENLYFGAVCTIFWERKTRTRKHTQTINKQTLQCIKIALHWKTEDTD
jgi:hypothetical protein